MPRSLLGLVSAVCILAALTAGCLREEKTVDLRGRNILLVVSEKDFRDSELLDPKDYFVKAGASVKVASTNPSKATGVGGLELQPDLGLGQAVATDYDAVVFVGGPGAKEHLWNNEDAAKLAKQAYESGRVVAAICLSPVVLARAGILQGARATGFDDDQLRNELEAAGATYTARRVEVDGRIVTANGPAAARDFAVAVAKAIEQ